MKRPRKAMALNGRAYRKPSATPWSRPSRRSVAARAEGLGLGWVSILDPGAVKSILDLPENWAFTAYLCLGWPEEEHHDPELERHGWQERMRQASVKPLLR